jgi:ketosteroid isomerase-like protein
MSEANVEIVRRVLQRLADQDIDGALEDVDPQATLDWSNSEALDSGVYIGHAGWRVFMEARDEALDRRRFDSPELLSAAPDTVVLIARVMERGRTSGIEVESRGAAVWRLSAGRVVSMKIYQSSDDALKAVGLAE